MLEFHFCVRHKDIQPCEHQPGQNERDEAYREFHDRSQQHEVIHLLEHGAYENGKTAGNYN